MAAADKPCEERELALYPGRNLIKAPEGFWADEESLSAFRVLQSKAKEQGIELCICSAFRSFDRQYLIFKDKFEGRRLVLDADEQPINISGMTTEDKIKAITYFSAIPGLSRHHLGTDFDVYAGNLLPPGQTLQLTYHEYEPGAYFEPLGKFLAVEAEDCGFVRPFMRSQWKGGPEPWHLSYQPRAQLLLSAFNFASFAALYKDKSDDFVPAVLSYGMAHFSELLCVS